MRSRDRGGLHSKREERDREGEREGRDREGETESEREERWPVQL